MLITHNCVQILGLEFLLLLIKCDEPSGEAAPLFSSFSGGTGGPAAGVSIRL